MSILRLCEPYKGILKGHTSLKLEVSVINHTGCIVSGVTVSMGHVTDEFRFSSGVAC